MPKTKATKLKIGLVLDDTLDSTDGVQQYVLAIGQWLKRQGHDVHYLVGQTKRQDVTNIHSLSRNVKVRFNGNSLSIPLPAQRRQLKKLLAAEQFDVLHVQMPFSPWLAGRIIKAAGSTTAIIGTFHILPNSWLSRAGSRVLALWSRRSWRRFDKVFSVSSAAQKFAKDYYGADSQILPNVIDYHRFAAAKPFAKKELIILFLGRLVPRKGCRYLIEALARLDRDELPPFRVLICGKGPLLTPLKHMAEDEQLEDIVEFTGFVSEEDKPRYYATADIAVFPSTGGESFGIVLLEAMAHGGAVLAGDNPGYASVMHSRPELLFLPQDVAGFAKLLQKYLTDLDARQRAADWAGRYARQFDIEVIGPQLQEAYNQLHAGKNLR